MMNTRLMISNLQYYNPVTDMIEPTFREGFIKINSEINPDRVAGNNAIIRSVYELRYEKSNYFRNIKRN